MNKKLLPLLLVAGVILVALGIVFGRTLDTAVNSDGSATSSVSSSESSSSESSVSSTGSVALGTTKEFFCGGQVPEAWSVYQSNVMESGEFADAEDMITKIRQGASEFMPLAFSAAEEGAWLDGIDEMRGSTQLGILVMPGSEVERVVEALKLEDLPGREWSQRVVDSHTAHVLRRTGVSGGDFLFLAWKERAPEGDDSFDKGLVIYRWGGGEHGGTLNELAFDQFLDTLALEDCLGASYPVVQN